MLALFVVFLLVGCYGGIVVPYTTPETEYTFYQAQVDPNQESVRVIQKEGFETYGSRIDIVELTNSQFKILVYYDDPFLEMRLIVPAGEELLIEESFAIVFNTATQQELTTVDIDWKITSIVDRLGVTREVRTKIEDDTGRLIGLISSPPATTYLTASLLFVNEQFAEEINLKLPTFRTKGNESIKFSDVTFKIYSRTEYKLHTFPYN